MKQLTQEDIKKIIYRRLKGLLIEHVDPIKLVHLHIMETELRTLTKLETERAFASWEKVLKNLDKLS